MSNPVVILNLPRVVDTAGTHHTVVAAANRDSFSTTTTFSEISDEEEKDACSVNCVDNGKNQEPTINVVNSSDVVIGSVTQFHGPVTIVQHLPPQQSIEDKHCEANLVTADYTAASSSKDPKATCSPKRYLTYFSTIFVLIALIALSIILSINTFYNPDINDLDEDIFEENSNVKQNMSVFQYYDIEAWGGRPPLRVTPITHPILFVIVSHTASRQCLSNMECRATMRNIQGYHVTIGEPNIGYNFLIGGDGNVYEGRGWDAQNFHRDSTLGISFIGNYIFDELTDAMIDAFDNLLDAGVLLEVLPPTFQLVAHNHTVPTLSPGQNVYRMIKHRPNFYSGLLPTSRVISDAKSISP